MRVRVKVGVGVGGTSSCMCTRLERLSEHTHMRTPTALHDSEGVRSKRGCEDVRVRVKVGVGGLIVGSTAPLRAHTRTPTALLGSNRFDL